MQMHDAKRVEIIIEAVMEKQVAARWRRRGDRLHHPAGAGRSGRSGRWTREGMVGRASGMIAVICLIAPDRLDGLLEALFPVLTSISAWSA
jgi:hypothetical protein